MDGVTGGVNVVGTNGATFYVTGVQLEEGVVSTNFDVIPYGTQLSLCQRYYLRLTGGSQFTAFAVGGATSTTGGVYAVTFPVPMRAVPNVAYSDLLATDNVSYSLGITGTITSNLSTQGGRINAPVASGQTAFRPQTLAANTTSSFLEFSAEL